ncbi:tRNA (adenosine(37)-N6)-dimethylallyltransferase MiaA [Lutimonas zeaxanthinifaciens]|uniref:tRNA (adenosine(37)-N6)-dimethylallyltransferase MiaA n=1 Tax=Lutimonas zeaxanthinifaciens TaxID=3060215 RepID=UPI00265CFD37|nr:tRNA (adenosine(37)-N6)-dimethylallyltransferase MiaA [Lutimonas sp. YSD2104]WKK67239.1 tRNA (adenosine(37)-N6)-dimethylallyltransferase MiaA [Lutimonas sp. YSD2104]
MKSKHLITVVGPTGIGKTRLGIVLAQAFQTEIISCDSRQFYTEMSIGTAVPSEEELNTVKHHFIQNRSIFEDYSVGAFEEDALQLLSELFTKYDSVIMVGGSGLYVDAVTKGLDEFPHTDPEIRSRLKMKLEKEGIGSLQNELKKRDPKSYERIDLENKQRLIRALEVCIGSGKPYSQFLGINKKHRPFKNIKIGIAAERELVYERINQRVDLMIKSGLVEEARGLFQHKHLNALQTVGYKELFAYFDGKTDLNFAIEEIKKNTRRFAKRQGTWFRRDKDITWFDCDSDIDQIIDFVSKKINS